MNEMLITCSFLVCLFLLELGWSFGNMAGRSVFLGWRRVGKRSLRMGLSMRREATLFWVTIRAVSRHFLFYFLGGPWTHVPIFFYFLIL